MTLHPPQTASLQSLTTSTGTSVCVDLAQAEKELQSLHTRLDELEDRIYGGQPRNGSTDPSKPPDGLGALAERVRSSVNDADTRIYKILERL